ncbi:unnamed protein product, partial [Ranitomeya imitator]
MRYATFAPKSRFNDAKSAISQPMKGADQESDPDETMLPHHERYTTDRHGDTDEVAHELQEEKRDLVHRPQSHNHSIRSCHCCTPARLWKYLFCRLFFFQASDPLARLSTKKPEVQKEIVDLMNKLRREVEPSARNMLEVVWNEEAAQNAERWANQCSFKHSKEEEREITRYPCGENLFMASYNASWEHAMMSFYNERRDFVYGVGPKTKASVVGHYTQLAWATSWELGCAVARCLGKKYEYYYVCQQCPAVHRAKEKGKEEHISSNASEYFNEGMIEAWLISRTNLEINAETALKIVKTVCA